MKATKLLEQQHRKVEKLFEQIESGDAAALKELANNLAGHMTIEQEIFYPAVHGLEPDKIAESFEEHSVAEVALKRALRTDPSDDQFEARITVLKELIQHHVEEEEKELFPGVEDKLSSEDLENLTARMVERFDEVIADGYADVLPEGCDETSADAALDELSADEDAVEAEASGEADADDEEDETTGADQEADGKSKASPRPNAGSPRKSPAKQPGSHAHRR